MTLENRTILITGGTSGIGRGFVRWLYSTNRQIIVIGNNEHHLQNLKNEFPRITMYRCNLSLTENIKSFIDICRLKHNDIDVLINCAGIEENYFFNLESSIDEHIITNEIQINLTAPILITNGLLSILSKRESAVIINVSSALVYYPKVNAAVYSATKIGLHHFSMALMDQLKNTNIKVFSVLPPLTDTPLTQFNKNHKISVEQFVKAFEKEYKQEKRIIKIGRAKWVYFLHRIAPSILKLLMSKYHQHD